MKLKDNLTEEFLDDIASTIDNEGLGYMILQGGLRECAPVHMLDDEKDIIKVSEALKTVREYAELLPSL